MSRPSLEELQDLFAVQLAAMVDCDEEDLIRLDYQMEGQPFHDATRDICYYHLQTAADAISRQIDTRYEGLSDIQARQVQSYTRVLELSLTLYGSNAYDKAVLLRLDLLNPLCNRELKQAGLYVVPDIAEPYPLWEQYNNKWLQRVDLRIRYNNRITDDERHTVGYIQAVPITVVGGAEERRIEIKEGEGK